ncbi:MAG: hypothetical protein OEV78_10365 [Spirochaetia bacterium]|nr:hypothetical protein [Spirochaetia bacterium]
MSLHTEQIQTLNKIMKAIDEKAAQFKDTRFDMREAQSQAHKKLLLDLIESAKKLADEMNPKPAGVLDDLRELSSQISKMN